MFSRYGYSPSEDSAFANQIFDPAAVEQFFMAPEGVKQMLMNYHCNMNYSVVDLELIDDLYRHVYQERYTASSDCGSSTVVVHATGYRPADPLRLLGELGRSCCRDEQGRLRVERDYRMVTAPPLSCGMYLQGGTEHTHGITSSLLSNGAIRSKDILQSIIARRDSEIPLVDRYVASASH